MNKVILVLFFLIPVGVFAQTSIGIRGGYATSSYSYQPNPSTRSRSVDGIGAPTFAFVLEHLNTKNAGIELNLQSITLGFRQFNLEEDLNETEFNYLKFPVLASFFVGRSGRFQVKIGPHLGYLLSATDNIREFSGETPAEIPTYGGNGDNPNKFMYGITAGGGISKLFGKSTISGEVRFAYDFTNPESQGRIFDMNSTNLEFSLAYLFRVKEKKP
jgi:hypothetical protein